MRRRYAFLITCRQKQSLALAALLSASFPTCHSCGLCILPLWSVASLPGVVKPDNVVVFYPTRYDVGEVASRVSCPVAAFFAEHDVLPGATLEDAHALREKLQENENVRTQAY